MKSPSYLPAYQELRRKLKEKTTPSLCQIVNGSRTIDLPCYLHLRYYLLWNFSRSKSYYQNHRYSLFELTTHCGRPYEPSPPIQCCERIACQCAPRTLLSRTRRSRDACTALDWLRRCVEPAAVRCRVELVQRLVGQTYKSQNWVKIKLV